MRTTALKAISILLAAALAAGAASAEPKFKRAPGAPEPAASDPATSGTGKSTPEKPRTVFDLVAPKKPRFQRPESATSTAGTAQVVVTGGDDQSVYDFDLTRCSVDDNGAWLSTEETAVPGFELVYDGVTKQGYALLRVAEGNEIRATGGAFDVTDGNPSGAYDRDGSSGKVIFKSECK